jgi:ABC-type multidrug transport system fused ATPase/permease subunit
MLSFKSSSITSSLFSRALNQKIISIQKNSSQQLLYSLTTGVEVIAIRVIGTFVSVVSDIFLMLLLVAGLLLVDISIALSTILLFGVAGLALHLQMNVKARRLGIKSAEYEITSNEIVLEALNFHREAFVRNAQHRFVAELRTQRRLLADVQASSSFLPFVSKYVLETTLVVGGLLVAGSQFYYQTASHAVATLSLFLAAGSRITPAVLRVQQGVILLKTSLGISKPTLDLLEDLREIPEISTPDLPRLAVTNFIPKLEISNLYFYYDNGLEPAVHINELEVNSGETVAIVGPSGAGKTTLIDLILGVHEPSSGSVLLSGCKPALAVSTWIGKIAYVPQDVYLTRKSIRDNLILGLDESTYSSESINQALEVAQLTEFVNSLPLGMLTQIGERGVNLSGGQKQRIGIARALVTNPELLILDEATSAMDGQTEASISQAIHSLKGKVTVIMIAHRLSTARNSDLVVYMDQGRLLAKGSFDYVRSQVPDFDKQAALMGL